MISELPSSFVIFSSLYFFKRQPMSEKETAAAITARGQKFRLISHLRKVLNQSDSNVFESLMEHYLSRNIPLDVFIPFSEFAQIYMPEYRDMISNRVLSGIERASFQIGDGNQAKRVRMIRPNEDVRKSEKYVGYIPAIRAGIDRLRKEKEIEAEEV